jgi:hypothetical protein
MVEAAKHVDRSELLTALVAEATAIIEQARAVQAQRARAAAEAAEAAAAVKKAAEVAAAAARGGGGGTHADDAECRNAVAAGASAAGEKRRASCRTRAAPGCGVRGVLRRAQGPYHGAVRSPVRVRRVCGAADQDENPDVSRVPRAHPNRP